MGSDAHLLSQKERTVERDKEHLLSNLWKRMKWANVSPSLLLQLLQRSKHGSQVRQRIKAAWHFQGHKHTFQPVRLQFYVTNIQIVKHNGLHRKGSPLNEHPSSYHSTYHSICLIQYKILFRLFHLSSPTGTCLCSHYRQCAFSWTVSATEMEFSNVQMQVLTN